MYKAPQYDAYFFIPVLMEKTKTRNGKRKKKKATDIAEASRVLSFQVTRGKSPCSASDRMEIAESGEKKVLGQSERGESTVLCFHVK